MQYNDLLYIYRGDFCFLGLKGDFTLNKLRVVVGGTVILIALIVTIVLNGSVPAVVSSQSADADIEWLVPRVIRSLPHDTGAFTQGLLLENGLFYEGTGQRGESEFREVDPETGTVLRRQSLDDVYFGEGLALTDQWFIQLTWQEGVAFVYDRDTMESLGQFSYTGEGWGLCYDGERLFHSDGSERIVIRDPNTFGTLGQITVTIDTIPIIELNELECVGDSIYANVWNTDRIVRIDSTTGAVTAIIDASGLLTPEEQTLANQAGSNAVLNGIAYDPETEHFYITGKRWPLIFEVEFVNATTAE